MRREVMKGYKSVQIYVNIEKWKAFKSACAVEGLSMTECIESLIEVYLESMEGYEEKWNNY